MNAEQDRLHREWFKVEYPNTFEDAAKGMTDAEVIFAHSWCAWEEAVNRAETNTTQREQPNVD